MRTPSLTVLKVRHRLEDFALDYAAIVGDIPFGVVSTARGIGE
ncbi:hypothetical protein NY08_3325 [Rhodococcus sp. B7740]|nr:hypothetical protein NY08_3325 [Rhodococcus sp. B7740]